MIKKTKVGGLLIDAKFRESGSMVKDGKEITWDAGFQIAVILLEDTQPKKFMVFTDRAKAIQAKLDSVHWGALVELEINGKKVTDVIVLEDVLQRFYEEEA